VHLPEAYRLDLSFHRCASHHLQGLRIALLLLCDRARTVSNTMAAREGALEKSVSADDSAVQFRNQILAEGSNAQTVDGEHHDERPAAKRARSSYDKNAGQAGGNGEFCSTPTAADAAGAMDRLDFSSLKRYSQDTLDYPRRRATIACEICRSRKSRCDGVKPKCKLCSELGADCVYRGMYYPCS